MYPARLPQILIRTLSQLLPGVQPGAFRQLNYCTSAIHDCRFAGRKLADRGRSIRVFGLSDTDDADRNAQLIRRLARGLRLNTETLIPVI